MPGFSPDTSNLLESTAISSLQAALDLGDLRRTFKTATHETMLRDVPRFFRDVPEIMEAYSRASQVRQLSFLPSLSLFEHNPYSDTWKPVYFAIMNYLEREIARQQVEAARLAVSREEIFGMLTLAQKFVEREDLTTPFPGDRLDLSRSFTVNVCGHSYVATLMVSPDNRWEVCFQLDYCDGVEKASHKVRLMPKGDLSYLGITEEDYLYRQFYRIAEEAIRWFFTFYSCRNYALSQKPRSISGEPCDDQAAAVLMPVMQGMAGRIDGRDYLHFSGVDLGEADQIQKDPHKMAQFLYSVIRGYVRLLKAVLMAGNDISGPSQGKCGHTFNSGTEDGPDSDVFSSRTRVGGLLSNVMGGVNSSN